MYRNYIETCLDLDKLKEVNRNAPENVKYCNFLCQDFRDKNNWYEWLIEKIEFIKKSNSCLVFFPDRVDYDNHKEMYSQ